MDLTVTIVRHGNTFAPGEAPRRIGARTDLPLVASGVRQAEALGAMFAEAGTVFDRVLAAELQRTQASAACIVARQPGRLAVEAADWLREIDHGPDEGRSEDAVVGRIGRAALDAWEQHGQVPEGWIVAAEQRMAAWRSLWETAHGQLLLVTSNGAARFALQSDAGLQRASAGLPSRKLRTGAYGVIARERGVLRLIAWDQRP